MRLCEKIALSIAVGIFASGLRLALAPLEAEPAVPSLPHQLQQKPAAKPTAAAAAAAAARPVLDPPRRPPRRDRAPLPARAADRPQPTDFDVIAETLQPNCTTKQLYNSALAQQHTKPQSST
ncbi:hypothetical protein DIPPA_11109 [Diplonema papillatum]|nr:hypothetical protein DIPPA_11109 [Diplonema papillatum]